jgi:hypothetical protein
MSRPVSGCNPVMGYAAPLIPALVAAADKLDARS